MVFLKELNILQLLLQIQNNIIYYLIYIMIVLLNISMLKLYIKAYLL